MPDNPQALVLLSQVTAEQRRIAQTLKQMSNLIVGMAATVHQQERRISDFVGERPPTADLDAACFSVYLHGDWRWLTRKMTTEQREAFADAADRHEATYADTADRGTPMDRWWRDDAPVAEETDR